MTPKPSNSTPSEPSGRQTQPRPVAVPASHPRCRQTKRETDTVILRVNGQLVAGEMNREEAESYLALHQAAEAGSADARVILQLMRAQEQVRWHPTLVAQLQTSIDMIQSRMQEAEPIP